ncbi:hypothetical protein GALMADRAFT_148631 [Galerina marginata CBS 339.88]|uniref:HAT C-terminal dimerisation domain-containing protein n=1 Tax=Galerina marginata (strain CBS 339.88) TaxID=685588 RepID=A0A067SCR8_GALM3|nr:hypothetical protein GALMADRAFT_148631 [Galerina marginata CBS 339.88]
MNTDSHFLPDSAIGGFLPEDLSQAPASLEAKFQELEARERRISEMWAKIQNWEANTDDLRLRAEKAEEQARRLTQQLVGAEERALTAETYISQLGQQAHPIESSRNSPFSPEREIFAPDADSSMRLEPEPESSVQEIIPPWKGKGRERFPGAEDDQDQGADDEDTDEEDRDAVMDQLQPSKAVNFATMNFPRSIIGAGPSLRLKATMSQENAGSSSSNAQFGQIFRDLPSVPVGGRTGSQAPGSSLEQVVVVLTGCVAKLTEQVSRLSGSGIDQAQRKKKYGGPRTTLFKLPPQRHTTPQRNDQLRAVRETMNTLLDIKHDADIVQVNRTDDNIIVAYEEERGPGPTPPYAPDWANIEGPWNYALLEIFMEAYTATYIVRDAEQQEDVCKMFMDRLRRLKKKVKQATQRVGETNMQMNQRLLTQHRRVLLNQRRNSRRNERFSVRSRITVQNAASQKSGDGRVIWEHLDEVLSTLGAGGMSSDESDFDDDGQKTYFVKKASWRRAGLVARMITIDRDRNFKNCYENITGNAPRPRKRRANATETSRRPIPGLPINFYDDIWYSRLDEGQKKLLGAKPALDLIEFQRVEGKSGLSLLQPKSAVITEGNCSFEGSKIGTPSASHQIERILRSIDDEDNINKPDPNYNESDDEEDVDMKKIGEDGLPSQSIPAPVPRSSFLLTDGDDGDIDMTSIELDEILANGPAARTHTVVTRTLSPQTTYTSNSSWMEFSLFSPSPMPYVWTVSYTVRSSTKKKPGILSTVPNARIPTQMQRNDDYQTAFEASSVGLYWSLVADLAGVKEKLNSFYQENYANYIHPSPLLSSQLASSVSSRSGGSPEKVSFTTRYRKKDRVVVDKLEEYLKVPREDFNSLQTLKWQLGRPSQFPNLYRLVCDVFPIYGSAVTVERMFSGGRDTFSSRRATSTRAGIMTCKATKRLSQWLLACVAPPISNPSLLSLVTQHELKAASPKSSPECQPGFVKRNGEESTYRVVKATCNLEPPNDAAVGEGVAGMAILGTK